MTDAAAALRRVAAIGPYFAVDLDPAAGDWRPLRALLDDPAVVLERVGFVRAALAVRARRPVHGIDARAAASIHQLGLASRLVAPSLAAAAVCGIVPVFDPGDTQWQRVDGGPVPIALRSPAARPVADVEAAATALLDTALGRVVAPVVDAFATAGRVSRIVLWGNVASALAGAASMLRRCGEPLLLDPVEVVAAVLARPGPLAGAGRFAVDGRFFVRASCCLFYRIPDAGKCGDCVLL